MSYGLYDGDLKLYPQVPFFNLELMKLSTYYKHKHEIVNFSPKFKPNMYTHFIIRQDYPSRQPYSTTYANLSYGGRAFDGETYKPLSLDIELCKPDTHLYDKIEYKIKKNPTQKFSIMRRAEHVRLSLDGKTVHPQWYKQLKNETNAFGLILHDYNLGEIEGAYTLIKDNISDIISYTNGARIGMKFPTQINTEEELINWLQLPPLNQYYSLQYNGILTTNHIKELQLTKSLQQQTTINPIANTTYEQFITTGIIELLQSILDLRRYRLVFPLIYDTTFFTDRRWVQVLRLFDFFIIHIKKNLSNNYYYTYTVPYETFYSCIKKEVRKGEIHFNASYVDATQAQQIFQFVREHNYELFKMFYEYTGELK